MLGLVLFEVGMIYLDFSSAFVRVWIEMGIFVIMMLKFIIVFLVLFLICC